MFRCFFYFVVYVLQSLKTDMQLLCNINLMNRRRSFDVMDIVHVKSYA